MGEAYIPTVDFSPFLRGDEDGKKKTMEVLTRACSEYGFFQIVNHGVSLDLMKEAMELSKTFFYYSDEAKSKSSPSSDAPLRAGYNRQPLHSPDKHEYLLVFPPGSSFNVFPQNPPRFRDVFEEMFEQDGMMLESIINEFLGLPTNFLKKFNDDRSWDFMLALRYFSASNNENNGLTEHDHANFLTYLLQGGVGGLQAE